MIYMSLHRLHKYSVFPHVTPTRHLNYSEQGSLCGRNVGPASKDHKEITDETELNYDMALNSETVLSAKMQRIQQTNISISADSEDPVYTTILQPKSGWMLRSNDKATKAKRTVGLMMVSVLACVWVWMHILYVCF